MQHWRAAGQSMRKCIEAMRKHFNPLLLPTNALVQLARI